MPLVLLTVINVPLVVYLSSVDILYGKIGNNFIVFHILNFKFLLLRVVHMQEVTEAAINRPNLP